MLLDLRCAGCGAAGAALCARCRAAAAPAPALAPPIGVDRVLTLSGYDGPMGALVRGLKYGNDRRGLSWAVPRLAALVGRGIEVITWAPTTPDRRRQRGFDQAEVLARALGRATKRPVRPLLVRLPGPPQVGRSAHERRTGVQFEAKRPCAGPVILVDDVVTTGATAAAAARVLRTAGATTVTLVAVARAGPRTSSSAGFDPQEPHAPCR